MTLIPATTAPLLLPQHLADLRGSGLNDDTIRSCGFYSTTNRDTIARVLGLSSLTIAGNMGPCLVLPFRDPADASLYLDYIRLKPDAPRPRADGSGKGKKYESPRGHASRVYFPPATIPILSDPNVPLLITEGEKKSAKATQEGFACLGLVGVWGWNAKRLDKSQPFQLLDDLAQIAWQGREVAIVFDSDAADNPAILRAESELAYCLQQVGAKPYIVRLPGRADGGKNGLDDFLCAHPASDLLALMSAGREPANAAAATQYRVEPGSAPVCDPAIVAMSDAERDALIDRLLKRSQSAERFEPLGPAKTTRLTAINPRSISDEFAALIDTRTEEEKAIAEGNRRRQARTEDRTRLMETGPRCERTSTSTMSNAATQRLRFAQMRCKSNDCRGCHPVLIHERLSDLRFRTEFEPVIEFVPDPKTGRLERTRTKWATVSKLFVAKMESSRMGAVEKEISRKGGVHTIVRPQNNAEGRGFMWVMSNVEFGGSESKGLADAFRFMSEPIKLIPCRKLDSTPVTSSHAWAIDIVPATGWHIHDRGIDRRFQAGEVLEAISSEGHLPDLSFRRHGGLAWTIDYSLPVPEGTDYFEFFDLAGDSINRVIARLKGIDLDSIGDVNAPWEVDCSSRGPSDFDSIGLNEILSGNSPQNKTRGEFSDMAYPPLARPG
jgi:hypothetical protein